MTLRNISCCKIKQYLNISLLCKQFNFHKSPEIGLIADLFIFCENNEVDSFVY